jgi:hypothetical protein
MSPLDDLQDAVMAAVAAAAAHEGTALGLGEPIDAITDAVIGLRHASRGDFVERYAAASKALHENWTRRVGTPGYHKPKWMAIDNALSRFAREITTQIGFEGPWVSA